MSTQRKGMKPRHNEMKTQHKELQIQRKEITGPFYLHKPRFFRGL
jgi:hypothetical protein